MRRPWHKLIILVIFFVFFVGCYRPNPVVSPSPPVDTPVQPTQLVMETLSPTITPGLPLVILFNPDANAQRLQDEIATLLIDLAQNAEMKFESVSSISDLSLENPAIKIMVILLPDPGIAELAAKAPQIQFVGIGIKDISSQDNMSLIRASVDRPDIRGFLAGYVAAITTQDWRVAVISQAGSEIGNSTRTGFTNGVYYFCGLCRPVYPPYPVPSYPLFYEIAGEDTEWNALIDYFTEWQVKTIYIPPPFDQDDKLKLLTQSGFNLIADRAPMEGLQDHWVASILPADVLKALTDLWPQLLAGEGSKEIDLSITLNHINPNLFSIGRQRSANEVLEKLLEGYIDTGVTVGD